METSNDAARHGRQCVLHFITVIGLVSFLLASCAHTQHEATTGGPAPRDVNGEPVKVHFEH